MSEYTADIAVVGAGIVGQTAAITLARLGFTVLLIEQRTLVTQMPTTEAAWLDRCVALNLESQQLLRHCGIDWETFGAFCQSYSEMQVWDANSAARIHFTAAEAQLDSLGSIVPTQALTAALTACMQTYAGIRVLAPQQVRSHRLSEDSVTVCCEAAEYTVRLVIAADGVHSKLRALFGFETHTWDYQQTAVVATIQTERGDPACAYQQFAGKQGPIAFLPLPRATWYSLVWSTTRVQAEALCQLEPQAFATALKQAMLGYFGEITYLSAPVHYPLVMHHTKSYVRNRCVLIGDSAHTVHPLAGLGMNLGLKDVKMLSACLSFAKQQQRDLCDNAVLKRYHQRRYAEVWETIAFLEVIKRSFASEQGVLRKLRELGMGFVDKQAWLKKQFMKIAIGNLF